MSLKQVFAIFLSSCGSLLLAALTAFVLRLVATMKSVSTRERSVTLGTLAVDAIFYAEEHSAALKARTGTSLTGLQKLSFAIEYMLRQTRLSREEASEAIHANLAKCGEGAAVKHGS